MFDSITEIGTRKYIEINLFAILDECVGMAGHTVETLVKRVDKLMYNSKSSGRNRVTMKFGIE